jgi:hypothetical protein
MKIKPFFRIILAGILVVLVTSCATTPSGPAALAGTWTNSLGTVWTINPDGSFSVVGTKSKRQIWGNITVAGDTITIQETRGQSPKNCKLAATYKFSRPDPKTLAFTLVKDTCKERIKNVTLPWHRQ